MNSSPKSSKKSKIVSCWNSTCFCLTSAPSSQQNQQNFRPPSSRPPKIKITRPESSTLLSAVFSENMSRSRRTSLEDQTTMRLAVWCVETIEAAPDDQLKGIYIQNGKLSLVEQMESVIEKQAPTLPTLSEGQEAHDLKAVASLLKRHIRRLPYPIIPETLYSDLVAACNEFAKTQNITKLRYAVRKLPPHQFAIAKLLLTHFWRLSTQRHPALVTPVALAISWTPNLFDDAWTGGLKNSDLAVYEASLAIAIRNFITETLILQADVIFRE